MRNALCISVVSVLLRQGFRHRLDTGRGSARSLAKMYAIPGEDRLGLGQGSARSFSVLFFCHSRHDSSFVARKILILGNE